MNLTVTDNLETTGGRLPPFSICADERRVYAFDTVPNELETVAFGEALPVNQYIHSLLEIELSSGTSATIPWDYDVLLYDGDYLPAHELMEGQKVAYFARTMRHEKYAAMRVIPFMEKRILEHRFVWEEHSGMDIPSNHSIDHIDNDSYNNHYSNLRSLNIRAHSAMTANRQRNRHTRRNADGSFAKGSTTTRLASADKPIPDSLYTGVLSGACRITSMTEVIVDSYYFEYQIEELHQSYVVMGNLLVQPPY